jgi:hypothetical protein
MSNWCKLNLHTPVQHTRCCAPMQPTPAGSSATAAAVTWVVVAAPGVLKVWMAHHWLLGALVLLAHAVQAHPHLQRCALGLLLLLAPLQDPAQRGCSTQQTFECQQHVLCLHLSYTCSAWSLSQDVQHQQHPSRTLIGSSASHV